MLARANRLTNSRSFDVIYKKGECAAGKYLVLYVLGSKYSVIKVGFVVGKKVGGSVVRNKVKRRLREAVKGYMPLMTKGYSYVFVARSKAAELDFEGIRDSVFGLLKKANKVTEVEG